MCLLQFYSLAIPLKQLSAQHHLDAFIHLYIKVHKNRTKLCGLCAKRGTGLNKVIAVLAIQLLEYQLDVRSCRFDTLGRLKSGGWLGGSIKCSGAVGGPAAVAIEILDSPTAYERWVLLHGGQGSISPQVLT